MPTVLFRDGSMLSGKTWKDLERSLREDAWNPSNKADFREEMARRAWNWSGYHLLEDGKSAELFAQLEEARLCIIVEDPEEER